MRLRRYRPADAAPAYALFRRAVHKGAAAAYSAEERRAWAPDREMPADWPARLGAHITWLAFHRHRLAGFMTLARDGHLDLAYVAPEAMGRGVADALYARLEAEARARGLPVLDTAASHLARSFFLRHGWQVAARQSVIRNGVALTNFRMEKCLAPPDGG
ncbi:GNAT family N-acetyltransferase [Maritimibacter sp. 55A14]|uniref:GNAT family N-acetyltransferase n=1 Tax=Maritimibacter sp. 55A14 TaxID=2174844 RepID=UPI000D6216AE|nr:GNAT family N-acetyltransferase [Maritimibacter sp. 55A14]PWE34330.1 GNAT family N-acetyltransferase [Maritimibacter sp. 55A14]